MSTAIILINSPSVLDIDKSYLSSENVKIYCADGGANYAHKLKITPNAIVGDLDSVDAKILEEYKATGVTIINDLDKYNTDLEKTINYAVKEGAKEIQIAGSLEGRPDQALGNFLLLASPMFKSVNLSIITKNSLTLVLQTGESRKFNRKAGEHLSLIPIKDSVVSLKGTKWELSKQDMSIGNSEGLSNLIENEEALIKVHEGTVFLTHSINID